MSDFKSGGVPAPDYDSDDINYIFKKTEFSEDVFVYGKLYADLGGDVQTFSTAGVERFRITKEGDVAIGTNNPNVTVDASNTSILAVGIVTAREYYGTFKGSIDPSVANDKISEGNSEAEVVDTGSNGHFKVTTEGTEKFRITSDGHFGTNGVTPTTQAGKVFHLHAGAAQQRFHMTNNTTGVSATDGFEIIVEESADVRIRNFEAGDLMFNTGGSAASNEVMHLTSTGNVGINETSPTSQLVVRATTDDNPAITFYRQSTGNDIAALIWKTAAGDQAMINYRGGGGNEGMQFYIGGTSSAAERVRIDLNGDTTFKGDINLSGTDTTTNQNRRIFWTGFDKETVGDLSDTAEIRHTTNVHGITGSVLEILSRNDATDGIALNAGDNGTGQIALVANKIDVSGYIEPSYGAGDNGIKWASDPSGGSGDIATIQYYQDGSGEDTRLRILIENDTADDLRFEAGEIRAQGSFSKLSGSFRIPHVLTGLTTTTDLIHSFVEGPQADNLYRGRTTLVAGISTVNIDTINNMTDGTFVNLNRDVQCFTTNETGWTAIKGSVTGNQLTIIAQDNTCTDTISWMVIGERWDLAMYDPKNPMTDANGKVKTEIPNDSYNKGGSYEQDYISENRLRVGISTISRPAIENKEIE